LQLAGAFFSVQGCLCELFLSVRSVETMAWLSLSREHSDLWFCYSYTLMNAFGVRILIFVKKQLSYGTSYFSAGN